MRAAGANLNEIATQTQVSRQTIAKTLNKPRLQTLIETQRDKLLNDFLPTASNNIKHCLDSFRTPGQKDKQLQYFGYKASEKVLEAVGIFTSHSPSIMVQQIYNNQQIHVHPVIAGLLSSHGQTFDAEFEEEEEEEK